MIQFHQGVINLDSLNTLEKKKIEITGNPNLSYLDKIKAFTDIHFKNVEFWISLEPGSEVSQWMHSINPVKLSFSTGQKVFEEYSQKEFLKRKNCNSPPTQPVTPKAIIFLISASSAPPIGDMAHKRTASNLPIPQ